MNSRTLSLAGVAILMFVVGARGEIKIVVEHNPNQDATPQFKFKNVPSPSKRDAATTAKFTIVDGERDGNGAELDVLHDGQLPREEDEPAAALGVGRSEPRRLHLVPQGG